MISIIIPTLNEEDNLLLLLESIRKQNFKDYEVIVSDAGSKDRTLEVAQQYGCKIVDGGLPSKGRNEGAKIAKGDPFLFLDADIILPEGSLAEFWEEFQKRNLDIASSLLYPLSTNGLLRFGFNVGYNLPIIFLEKLLPHGCNFIMAKKRIHEEIGGFDEEVILCEDLVYMRAGAKVGKFGVLRANKILLSPRRLEQDGWVRTGTKLLIAELYVTFIGKITKDIFLYHFNPYEEEKRIYKSPGSTLGGWKFPLQLFYYFSVIILPLIWLGAFLFFIFGSIGRFVSKIFK